MAATEGAMTKSLTPRSPTPPKIGAETMEKVLILGDLKALTPLERVSYYDAVCKSLGLNPLTRQFDLNLNGKTQLYAKRECTEQLRQIRGVNLTIKAREVTEGCYVVTAAATLPNGRQDESIGAVPIEGLKGENRSNALMKAEAKAKRRVTLSICGLTFLDESEVDSVRGASHVAIDPQTGEVLSPDLDRPRNAPPPPADPEAKAPVEQEAPTRPWRSFKGMLEEFAKLRGRLGPDYEHVYHSTLEAFCVEHSNAFKDGNQAAACYRQLLQKVLQVEDAAREAEAMPPEDFEPPEPEAVL
jgi:hypothetical protein